MWKAAMPTSGRLRKYSMSPSCNGRCSPLVHYPRTVRNCFVLQIHVQFFGELIQQPKKWLTATSRIWISRNFIFSFELKKGTELRFAFVILFNESFTHKLIPIRIQFGWANGTRPPPGTSAANTNSNTYAGSSDKPTYPHCVRIYFYLFVIYSCK